jgi:predicted transcriptional regulator
MKPLIDIIFASEKRMDILLLLHSGQKEMTTLIESLDTTRQSLLPQLKILNEKHFIRRIDDSYELTTLGRLIVNRMLPLTNIATLLDCEWDFLGTHYLDFIPQTLIERIDELGNCYVVETTLPELFDVNEEMIKKALESKFYYEIISFIHPNFKKVFSDLTGEGVDVSIIISRDLREKLIQDKSEEFQALLGNSSIKIYLYPDNFGFVSFTLANHAILLRLLTQEGNYDNKQIIFANGNAHKWGEEFFEYYVARSERIREI